MDLHDIGFTDWLKERAAAFHKDGLRLARVVTALLKPKNNSLSPWKGGAT